MKRAFLLIAVPTLLVALGFAQTPAASTNPDQTNIKGCLGGSDGNYTVMEDNTGRIFKLTTSSVDLKPHLSHDVTLIGHRASGASSAAADDSFAVTELNMISEHCAVAAAAAAAAPAATTSTVAENAITPAADSTPPAETAITPAAAATPPAETAITPAAAAACARCHYQHSCGECHHTRCSRYSTYGDGCHTRCGHRCRRRECQHAFRDYRHTCCTSPETIRNTCCSHHYTRCDCQLVLGDCQHTCCSRHYTRRDFQHILGPCQHTRCSRHYTHRHFQGLVLLALDCGCRGGCRHWRSVPFLQQVEKKEEFGANGRPKSFFYPRSELRTGQQ
jgi:hypothetical protein